MNKKLEKQLWEAFNHYQAQAHPEDRMSFIDYAMSLGRFQGHRVEVKQGWDFEYVIRFTKIK
jgi:hypothetical protein